MADDDCTSGDCDAVSSTCAKTCNSVTITTESSYNSARECSVINGDLVLDDNVAPTIVELPQLIRITGDLKNLMSGPPIVVANVTEIRLPKLTAVGGDVDIYRLPLTTLSWPELTTVGGDFELNESGPEVISLPKLRQTGSFGVGSDAPGGNFLTQEIVLTSLENANNFSLYNVKILTDLEVPNIQHVQFCNFTVLPFLPFSMIEWLVLASDQSTVSKVGCCLSSGDSTLCPNFDTSCCSNPYTCF